MARLDRDYRIPTEARDDHERREMEAGWALVEAAGQRVREALEAAEKAFAEHDRAEQEGEKLAKDLLSAINIVTARQDGQA
jgi:F0F1-type ATP synthase assembly protein I